jgi:hypothetical protein
MQKIIYVKQTASNCLFKKEFYVVGEENGSGWKKFLRKHWNIVVIFVAAGVLGFAGAIYVYLWFVGDAQATGLVPSTLGLWTMGHLVWFILHAVFWELLFIGIPAIIGAVAGWQWWKRLPDEDKKEYHFFGKRSRTARGGGGVSAFFFVAFAIKVYVDGNWNVAIATWTLNYIVYSMFTILAWVLVIFGIPATIALIWWLHREIKQKT